MEKRFFIFISLICLQLTVSLHAQVSHGGQPLPLSMTKSINPAMYVDMPGFDLAEQLRIDSLNTSDLRSGYPFAYKFMTQYTPANSGIHFTTPDGTRIWRLGIRSANACSINIMFTEFELPEGARLFLYNADQTQVLGSFNYLNNSERGILPVSPVNGSELIIEYQEPAQAAFRGKLTVGEVNHGYRDFKAFNTPQPDQLSFSCMNALACYQEQTDDYKEIGRSVVLLIINGSVLCTGTLVNNTSADKKPYLLTASHCLNNSFTVINPDYEEVAGSIICFFNYNSPLCSTVMQGTEEMSTASAHYRAVNEKTDLALLELSETPPAYYQPYYAGWNAKDAGEAPYAGIHHPMGSVKRINFYDKTPALSNYYVNSFGFISNSFWQIDKWTVGATAGGSSGSPLFDAGNRIIGALTGGISNCNNPIKDYYYSITKSWKASEDPDKQLKYWLNPAGDQEKLSCDGHDPYETQPCYRISNISENGKKEFIEKAVLPSGNTDYLFGTNTLRTTEYAEKYQINGNALLYGTYIVNPAIKNAEGLKVEINVYNNVGGKPGSILHSEVFQPTILYKGQGFQQMPKPLTVDQESFIPFSQSVNVGNSFFIGYKIIAPPKTAYTVFSLKKGETTQNTAYIRYKNDWIPATSHPVLPYATSLFIDPVIQYQSETANEQIWDKQSVKIFVGAEKQTIHILLQETGEIANISLITMKGEILQKWTIREQQTTLPVGSVQPGLYIVQVFHNNKLYTQKIIF